ncbi:hypothetical protein ABFS83_04G173400 [Erythranthe nasuta]
MAAKMRIGPSFSCLSTSSSPCQRKELLKLNSRLGLFEGVVHSRNLKVSTSCQLTHRKLTETLAKRRCILFATSENQESHSEIELDNFEQGQQPPSHEDTTSTDTSHSHTERADGKPGFISFYGHTDRRKDQIIVSIPEKNRNYLLWFAGPTVLVASFIFPSLYLRRILSTVFEDSLLTDFLILFFTEALFYCGVAVFILLMGHLRKSTKTPSETRKVETHYGERIASVAVLVLSLIIPMVTMGFVWPWTGPAASATLAPYLVGIVVQYAFEQYAKRVNSPSGPAIPIIFQVYRLHQLNRAAQLVTALSFTVRGAEMTSHNLAINGSLNTLLNVLQFLGIICIWSLSSFVMRFFLSEQ